MILTAGSRIKGITIEINGSTTGLDKALKEMNATISTSQRSLKDLNRLLKLDPSNTTLLAQKQRLLGDSIQATEEKLNALKTAQEQAKSQLENGDLGQDKYEALQREIVETEQSLESLIKQAAESNQALSKMDDVGKKMEAVGDSVSGVGKKLTASITTPILGVGTAAVAVATGFDEQMSKVSAISGATGKDFDALRAKAREMGAKTKFSASEAGAAMEYMAMAGWKTGDMLDGVEGIMNLAAASGENLATTSDIVTDALTAFGLTAKDSGHFADVLAAASSNANTNVSMLGESFKYVAPVAGSLGYSAEDTSVALGLMANSGIKASQAGTALRTLLTNMAKPTDSMAAAMDNLGVSLDDGNGNMLSFMDVMKQLRSGFGQLKIPQEEFQRQLAELDSAYASGELTQKKYNSGVEDLIKQAYGAEGSLKAETAAMLAGKEGMSGLLAIVNASDSDFEKLTNAIYHADGSAEDMANTMQDNLAGQLTILKSQLEELAISFADIVMPAIREGVQKIQNFVDRLNSMDDTTRRTIVGIAAFAAAIGPLLLIMGTLISRTGKTLQGIAQLGKGFLNLVGQAQHGMGILHTLSGVISGITAPMVAVTAAIAILIAAFAHLWKTNEEFRNNVLVVWERVKSAFAEFATAISDRLSAIGINFSTVTRAISAVWDGFCNLLAPVFTGAFNAIASILETVLQAIIGILDVLLGVFTGNWSQVWTGVKEIFSGVWNGICGILTAAGEILKGTANTILGWFGSSWSEAWKGIKNAFESVWNGIASLFSGIWKEISTIASVAWNTIANVVQVGILMIKEIISAAFQIITIPFRFIWENCKEYLIEAWNVMAKKVSGALNTIQGVVSSVWNRIRSVISTILSAIQGVVSNAWNRIKSVISTILSAIQGVISNAWNRIKSVISTVLSAIQGVVSGKWNAIRDTVSNAVGAIKSRVSSGFGVLKNVASNIFGSIKNTIADKMSAAKNAVGAAISQIREKFHFSWSLPKLKMPHPKISGKFNLNPPEVPKFSIDWYKKAMNAAMVMDGPTVFGYNAKTSQLLAGGETGREVVSGEKHLLDLIGSAVSARNTQLADQLAQLTRVVQMGFPQVIHNMDNLCVVLDSGEVVGYTAAAMDRKLGVIGTQKARHN